MSTPGPFPITPPNATPRHRITSLLTFTLVIFLILFPKGGVKVGPVPLTWGYLILAASLPPLALVRVVRLPLRMRKRALLALATLVPFQVTLIYSTLQNGVSNTGYGISMFVAFFVFPFAFLFVYPAFLDRIDGRRLARQFRFCIFVAAVYGLILFVVYPITGKLFEVPYLTVNADDYGLIAATKHIDRGGILKLISTYNNGNLYGVATLMLLPLYDKLETRSWKRVLLKMALVLTLSRTVWFGLILEQALSLLWLGVHAAYTFPRVVFGPALKRGVFIVLTIAAVLFAVVVSFGDIAFLFDKQLGGRSGSIASSLNHVTFLPAEPVNGFLEIIYTSALSDFGVLGLVTILLVFLGPIFIMLTDTKSLRSPLRRAAFKGLVLYFFLTWIDGALLLIPVMAFYWFVYMLFLEGWPGGLDLAVSRPAGLSDEPSVAAPQSHFIELPRHP